MSDNRLTVRLNVELLRAIDQFRTDFRMTRNEFVRHCVQTHLADLARSENEQIKALHGELDYLRRRCSSLEEENEQIKQFFS